MANLISVSGAIREVFPKLGKGKNFSLLEIHQHVEDVKGDGIDAVMVNEQLVMFIRGNSFWELEVNPVATKFVRMYRPTYSWEIHGPALVCDMVESGDVEPGNENEFGIALAVVPVDKPCEECGVGQYPNLQWSLFALKVPVGTGILCKMCLDKVIGELMGVAK